VGVCGLGMGRGFGTGECGLGMWSGNGAWDLGMWPWNVAWECDLEMWPGNVAMFTAVGSKTEMVRPCKEVDSSSTSVCNSCLC